MDLLFKLMCQKSNLLMVLGAYDGFKNGFNVDLKITVGAGRKT